MQQNACYHVLVILRHWAFGAKNIYIYNSIGVVAHHHTCTTTGYTITYVASCLASTWRLPLDSYYCNRKLSLERYIYSSNQKKEEEGKKTQNYGREITKLEREARI